MKLNNAFVGSTDLIADIPKLLRSQGDVTNIASSWEIDSVQTAYSQAVLMHVEIALEAVSEKITAIGRATLHWTSQCRRCLEATTGQTSIDINEIFEEGASEGETFELPVGEKLDLKPMLTEQAMLNLPLAALCSEACTGPSETKFFTHASGSVVEEQKDPRWAILDQLKLSDD